MRADPVARRLFRRHIAPVALLALMAAGCGQEGPSDTITGTALLNGEPVTGTITFVVGDKSSNSVPIGPKGDFRIDNPPKGQGEFVLKGMGGVAVAGPAPIVPKGGADLPMAKMAASPPAKYAQRGNGTNFTYDGGRKKHDLTLTP
jgi:hypothetical protein